MSLTPSAKMSLNMSSLVSNPGVNMVLVGIQLCLAKVLSVYEQVPLLRSTRCSPPTDPNWADHAVGIGMCLLMSITWFSDSTTSGKLVRIFNNMT